jgi:hypothetical protein
MILTTKCIDFGVYRATVTTTVRIGDRDGAHCCAPESVCSASQSYDLSSIIIDCGAPKVVWCSNGGVEVGTRVANGGAGGGEPSFCGVGSARTGNREGGMITGGADGTTGTEVGSSGHVALPFPFPSAAPLETQSSLSGRLSKEMRQTPRMA